ncbi:hypothetical protein HHI36_010263 [Cryptolaemus montrouzieri]|uniref:Vacuolar ATPase assembly integral membrane protein VMA21 homolog n=1 Tax=Cryptolaemus montrouzieri TaxID=559131 RepID=A0ABD2MI86_9CUCU
MADKEAFNAFKTVMIYISLILVAPICTFFCSKSLLFHRILGIDTVASNIWSAVFAMIAVHISLGLYIYRAYFYTDPLKPVEKVD